MAYKFQDAYDIKDKGVGHLNLDKAVKSEEFVAKLKQLCNTIKNTKITHNP